MIGPRLLLWTGSAALATVGVGTGWMSSTVEIPLIWVGVLTFIPTIDLVEIVRTHLDRFKHDP